MSRTRVLVTASVMVGVPLGVFGGAAHASAKWFAATVTWPCPCMTGA